MGQHGTLRGVAIRNRLCPGGAQEAVLVRHCGDARYVWNLAVGQQSYFVKGGAARPPGPVQRQRQLAEIRKGTWLAGGSSSVQQQALRDFGRAMAAFFDQANPAGKPSFRRKNGPQGFVVRDTKVRRLGRKQGEVWVPKLGWVRFRWTRKLPGEPGMARVTLDSKGRWQVSFPAPQPAIEPGAHRRTGRPGPGCAHSAGRLRRPALPGAADQRLPGGSLPRAAAPDGRSAQRFPPARAARREMARIAANVAGRRRDWAEKISTALVTGCGVIAAEKLNTPAMVRTPKPKPDPGKPGEFLPNGAAAKAGLNRGILSSCGGMLARRIEQKAAASAVTAVFATPVSPASSAVCVITPRQRTAITKRSAASPVVTPDHADVNAAKNVLARGLRAHRLPVRSSLRMPRGTGRMPVTRESPP